MKPPAPVPSIALLATMTALCIAESAWGRPESIPTVVRMGVVLPRPQGGDLFAAP